MRRALSVVGVSLALLVFGPAPGQVTPGQAGPFEDGLAAVKRADYATALRLWHPMAENGDAEAQLGIGVLYEEGWGVSQDYAEAAKWYRKAAGQGDATAQSGLGHLYRRGLGVPKNEAIAAVWYRKAAEQGNASAQASLGSMYGNGEGVPQDHVTAHMWFNLAAAQGHAKATTGRDFAATKLSPADLAKAQKMARDWLAARGK